MKKSLLLISFILISCNNVTTSNSDSFSFSSNIESLENSEIKESSIDESSIDEVSIDESSIDEVSIDESSIDESSSINDSSSEYKKIDVSDKLNYIASIDFNLFNTYSTHINDENEDINQLEIFEINDTHGAFYNDESICGIAKVATAIASNTTNENGVIKIANGDLLQGTSFSNMFLGAPAIHALNALNFDCFVIGNHEFDWNIENLAIYKDGNLLNGELNCPFLGANIVDSNGNHPSFIEPYTTFYRGNVKVGIIGVMGDGLESSISNVSLGGYTFTSSSEAVSKYCDILKNEENCDVIIVSVHDHDEETNQIYVNDNKIDCIINAHDHNFVEETVTRYDGKIIPVIESNTKNITLGKVTLYLNENKEMDHYEMKHFYPSNFTEEIKLKEDMNIFYEVIEKFNETVIARKAGGMSKKEIGILLCNYMASYYDCSLVFINQGGIRNAFKVSDITNALVYETLPFDNELYVATLTGSEIKKTLSNTSYYYFNNSGIGKGTILSDGISLLKKYKVATVDYVATKDYMLDYFDDDHDLIKTGEYARDLLTNALIEAYGI